jgi:VWFA-related protein
MKKIWALVAIAVLGFGVGLSARAIPRKLEHPPSPVPQQVPAPSIRVKVPEVMVDVVVTDDEGSFLTGLKKKDFRITQDGGRQSITSFEQNEAPLTTVLLVEYNKQAEGWFLENAKTWAGTFLRQLEPTDWIALTSFSMRPKVELDFTHRRPEIEQALATLIYPGSNEANLFDALGDTLDRLERVKGKKSVVVLASGLNTFSQATLDEALKQARASNVTVYSVGTAESYFMNQEMQGGTRPMTSYEAQRNLRSFTEATGGKSWFPRFEGEIPGIMADIAARLRHQYSLTFTPGGESLDGKFHKIKVELLAADGTPLTSIEQNGKKKKIRVYARQGYVAPQGEFRD